MKTSLLVGLLVSLASVVAIVHADDKKAQASPTAKTETSTQVNVIESGNVDDLRANEQHRVTVKGKVTRTKDWDGNGTATKAMNFIDLQGGYFTAVTFASDFDKFKSHPAILYKDKEIEITGMLETRNGRWQIKLTSPDQVKLISPAETKEAKEEKKEPEAVEKKEESKDRDATNDKTDTKDGKKRVDSKKFFK